MNMDDLMTFCKSTGFVFPADEIYGGYAGFWTYGPLGVELKNKIKALWWKEFVQSREDVVGIDGSIITHPRVWEASGHVGGFVDPLAVCGKCGERSRADHLVEDNLEIQTMGMSPEQLSMLIKKNKIKCPKCKSTLNDVQVFHLMFKTNVGPIESKESLAYLRPETAQNIFSSWKPVIDSTRIKLPVGIGQIGKAFRNEIAPRNFMFRSREFEQMEIEFFVDPDKRNEVPDELIKEVNDVKMNVLSESAQKENKQSVAIALKDCISKSVVKNKWQAYWIAKYYQWLLSLGISSKRLRIRQHVKEELSHYAEDTWDIDYQFPFGWKELMGNANRGQFDLTQHEKFSGKDLKYFDDATKRKFIPYVASEPSIGVDRLFLALISDAYSEEIVNDAKRVVLKLDRRMVPYEIGVFPLVSKGGLPEKAREVFNALRKQFTVFYDESGSIGRRYRRQDMIGTPFGITIDFQTLEDGMVTIRDRDTMEQKRVKISELAKELSK